MSITQSQTLLESQDRPKSASEGPTIPLVVEFTGGLELFFSNQRKHSVALPSQDEQGRSANLGFLVRYLCENLMTDRKKEMFVMEGTVRPGILVLVNEADWELEGGEQYELQSNDNILFVSTLHGG